MIPARKPGQARSSNRALHDRHGQPIGDPALRLLDECDQPHAIRHAALFRVSAETPDARQTTRAAIVAKVAPVAIITLRRPPVSRGGENAPHGGKVADYRPRREHRQGRATDPPRHGTTTPSGRYHPQPCAHGHRKHHDEHRVVRESRYDVPMSQVVKGAKAPAAGARKPGRSTKRACWIMPGLLRVHRGGERKKPCEDDRTRPGLAQEPCTGPHEVRSPARGDRHAHYAPLVLVFELAARAMMKMRTQNTAAAATLTIVQRRACREDCTAPL